MYFFCTLPPPLQMARHKATPAKCVPHGGDPEEKVNVAKRGEKNCVTLRSRKQQHQQGIEPSKGERIKFSYSGT